MREYREHHKKMPGKYQFTAIKEQQTMSTDFTFGELARESDNSPYANLQDGLYPAFIKSVEVAKDDKGGIKYNQQGKVMVDVRFTIDQEHEVRRRFGISFGQNKTNGKWAGWAEFLEAATGVKCGDQGQRSIKASEVEGQSVMIYVERNERGYIDVVRVKAPKNRGAVRSAAPPEPFEEIDDEFPL